MRIEQQRIYREPIVVEPVAPVTPPVTLVVTPPVTPIVTPPVAAPTDVNLAPASASTTLDISKEPAKPAEGTFVIPDAFKDKPYLKGVDSLEKLYAMLDGAQTLIGQKGTIVPKDDAPQTEWDAYYESLGRPKTAAEYKFEGADKSDPKFLPKVQSALHEAGLTSKQAEKVWTKVNVALGEYMKEKGIEVAAQDTDFNKLATDSFGVEREAVIARGKELLKELTSPNMKEHVAKLSNDSLIVLTDVLRNVDKKYIRQDGPQKPPSLLGGTPDELRAKARGLMEKQRGLDPMSQENQNLQKQIDACYDAIRQVR